MNKIYIYCDGGFGNRFNSLIFGLYVSKKYSYEPIIIWPPNNWCGADFDDLFDTDFSSIKTKENLDLSKTFNLVHENYVNAPKFTRISEVTHLKNIFEIKKEEDIFYANCIIPWNLVEDMETLKNLFEYIKFKKDFYSISNKIIYDNVGNNEFYGIHIRKTDFGEKSNLAQSMLLNIVTQNMSKKFFICSDDEQTESLFLQNKNVFRNEKKSYVEKIVEGGWNTSIVDHNKNEFPFNVDRSKQSVIEAVIDLLILSKSTIISPDVGSTFFHCANLLKHIQIANSLSK